tara:strand:- start:604 stop:2256 length:1653 start_codon:yes stop_codon:yes gene_type:complete
MIKHCFKLVIKISTVYRNFILFFILFFISCKSIPSKVQSPIIFKYNESAGILSFDPAFAKDQSRIWFCNFIYNSLVQLDSSLQIIPSISKSWNISKDGKSYEFLLRNDIYFHSSDCFEDFFSNRLLNASDVIYSLNRLRDPALASPGAWVLSDVSGIYETSDSSVVINLNKPNPAFLGLLSMKYCSIIPFEQKKITDFFHSPIGTGPFQFQYHKNKVKLVLRRHNSYFEFEGDNQLPFLDAISISFIPDKQTAFLEFIRGNFDFLSGLDISYKDELLDSNGLLRDKYASLLNYTKDDYLNTEYLGFLIDENQDNFALRDVRVRQALNYSFNRKLMIRYLRNNVGTPALSGFIPKGLPGFSCQNGYDYNPNLALDLLKQSGYPNAEGIPQITLSTTSSYLDLCEYIQHSWTEIGFKVNIDVSPPSTHRQKVSNGKLSLFRGSWIADYADAENYLSLFYSKNHSPLGPNYTHFSDSEFDSLYVKSISLSNLKYRIPLYQKMDSILINKAVVIPLYYDNVLRFSHKNIIGLGTNPMNLLDLKRVIKMENTSPI